MRCVHQWIGGVAVTLAEPRGRTAAQPAIAATAASQRQGLKVRNHSSGVRSVTFLDVYSWHGTLLTATCTPCIEFVVKLVVRGMEPFVLGPSMAVQ